MRNVPVPPTFERDDLFDQRGHLKETVFHQAVTHLNQQSTPGYPYLDVSTNEQLNLGDLYCAVDATLRLWNTTPEAELNELFLGRNLLAGNGRRDILLFVKRFCPCAHLFVKGEPTKKDKVARLIFGVSVIMNVIARILFGDFLLALPKTWDRAEHKVGMDFSSDAGLERFAVFVKKLYALQQQLGCDIETDDIQGWEWQSRTFMHYAFHDSLARRGKFTSFHKRLQNLYLHCERCSLVMASDGEILRLPFYITLSGKVLTHFQNSCERAALALMDTIMEGVVTLPQLKRNYANYPVNSDNGDDCMRPTKGRDAWSTKLGFVHTDRRKENLMSEFHFSSQVFFWTKEGKLDRRPDSLVKSAYKLLSYEREDGAYYDTLLYLVNHPGWRSLHALAQSLRKRGVGRVEDRDE